MPKPTVVVFSRSEACSNDLPDEIRDQFEFTNLHALPEVRHFICTQGASAFVADFRTVDDGGHAEARLIEDLRERLPELTIIFIAPEACPEPLERQAVCAGCTHLIQTTTPAAAYARLLSVLDALPEKATERQDASRPVSACQPSRRNGVMTGITRTFETQTPKLQRMLADLEVAAQHDVTVLLIGETGAGKTFLSKLIHEVSPRRGAPFLPVACGALPCELIESELFGHMKGSFTSAHADKDGKFVAAGQGTILLDEIDVLGPEQQVKLLRVIETGEFEPVGSNKTIRSQARLVVASNLDLEPLVESGRFRPDLYYRLNMLKFEIPPLRDRKPDIESLARKFIVEQSAKHAIEIREIVPELFPILQRYPWPGNVRELENVIQRAVIYCRDQVLQPSQLPSHILNGSVGPTNDPSVRIGPSTSSQGNQLGRQIAFTEQEIIEEALCKNNHSRTNTARDLGISRVTLYNKMKKYGLQHR